MLWVYFKMASFWLTLEEALGDLSWGSWSQVSKVWGYSHNGMSFLSLKLIKLSLQKCINYMVNFYTLVDIGPVEGFCSVNCDSLC
jgi:hypothetical protein